MRRGLPPSWRPVPDEDGPPLGPFSPSARLGTPTARVVAPTRPAWPRPQLRADGEPSTRDGSEQLPRQARPVDPGAPPQDDLDPDLFPVFHADVILVHGARRSLWMDLHHRRATPVDPTLAEVVSGWSARPLGEALATHGELARRVLRSLLDRELLTLTPWPELLAPRAVNLSWPGRLGDLVLSWGLGSDYPLGERVREAEALGARSILLRCSNLENGRVIEALLEACADTALSVDLWLPAHARPSWPADPHLTRVLLWGAPRAEASFEASGTVVESCVAPLEPDAVLAPSPATLVVDPELADAARLGHGLALGRLYVDEAGRLRASPLGPPLPVGSLEEALTHPRAVAEQAVSREQVVDCARCELRLCCPDAEPLVPSVGGWRRARPCGYDPNLARWTG